MILIRVFIEWHITSGALGRLGNRIPSAWPWPFLVFNTANVRKLNRNTKAKGLFPNPTFPKLLLAVVILTSVRRLTLLLLEYLPSRTATNKFLLLVFCCPGQMVIKSNCRPNRLKQLQFLILVNKVPRYFFFKSLNAFLK